MVVFIVFIFTWTYGVRSESKYYSIPYKVQKLRWSVSKIFMKMKFIELVAGLEKPAVLDKNNIIRDLLTI